MRYLLLILLLVFGCTYEESTKVIDRHENGKPRTEMTTKDGEIILMVRYFDNGNIQSIQNRKDGKPHGESIVYDINGNIILKTIFENGVEGKSINDNATIG